MRRKDREMDRDFALGVIDKARYGIVSSIDREGKPYGIPLSIVRLDNTLYFHSAMEGKKVEIFKVNPDVSVAFVGEVEVPENYSFDQLEEMNKDSSKAIKFISSVFTTEFESALVKGRVEKVEEREEKIQAMRAICQKYAPSKMKYFQTAIEAGLSRTNVYKIEIAEVSSKRKKYDSQGQEMKWARME